MIKLYLRNTASKRQILDFNLSILALNLILFPFHFEILNCARYSSSPLHLQRQLFSPHYFYFFFFFCCDCQNAFYFFIFSHYFPISIFTLPPSAWSMEGIIEPCSRNPVQFCHLSSVLPSIPLVYKPSKPLALRSLKSTSFVFLS